MLGMGIAFILSIEVFQVGSVLTYFAQALSIIILDLFVVFCVQWSLTLWSDQKYGQLRMEAKKVVKLVLLVLRITAYP